MKKILCILMITIGVNHLFAQLSVLTDHLNTVIGVSVDEGGNKWVTDQGTGQNDGQVIVVSKTGKKSVAFNHLPSKISEEGDAISAWKVIHMSYGRKALLMGGNGHLGTDYGKLVFFDLAGFVPGTSAPKTMADSTHSYDIQAFGRVVSGKDDSDPFSAVQDEDGNWFIADAAADAIIRISRNGKNRSVLAKFNGIPNPTPIGGPFIDVVPTGIIALPNYGGFLVTTLTGFPFLNGLASIYKVDRDGTVTPYLKGLTLLTDIAMDQDKTIYVNQFGKFSLPNGFVFGSGQVIRIRDHHIIDTIARGYGPGPGLAVFQGRKLYVTSLFTGEMLGMDIPIATQSASSSLIGQLETRESAFSKSLSLSTYPNPVSDLLQVAWNRQLESGEAQLQITDLNGRSIWQQNNVNVADGSKRINVSAFVPGSYIFTLNTKSGSSNQKFNVVR